MMIWKNTRKGLAFNVLADTDPSPADYIYYYSKNSIETICAKIAGRDSYVVREDMRGHQIHGYIFSK